MGRIVEPENRQAPGEYDVKGDPKDWWIAVALYLILAGVAFVAL